VIAEAMSWSASTTLQYTGIGLFIAIVLLGLVYFARSINTARRARRGGDAGIGSGHVDLFTGEQLGLAPDDVAVLPKFTYHAASPGRWGGVGKAKTASADGCAVCIEELQEGALVRMLPSCKHYFHASCVDVWLLSHATCRCAGRARGRRKSAWAWSPCRHRCRSCDRTGRRRRRPMEGRRRKCTMLRRQGRRLP
jgi:E3 ubiquitin-protein ligase ATL41